MKIKKKKKSVRQHGQNTYGWGSRKKRKGSGHRGGIGMAGTGKKADHKKSLVIKKYKQYFGKQGFTSRGTQLKKLKSINLREIQQNLDSLIKQFGKGNNELNLKNYKILGDGEITEKLIIKARACTKGAREKIEKAGGEVIVPIIKPKVVAKPKEEKEVKKEIVEDKKEKVEKKAKKE